MSGHQNTLHLKSRICFETTIVFHRLCVVSPFFLASKLVILLIQLLLPPETTLLQPRIFIKRKEWQIWSLWAKPWSLPGSDSTGPNIASPKSRLGSVPTKIFTLYKIKSALLSHIRKQGITFPWCFSVKHVSFRISKTNCIISFAAKYAGQHHGFPCRSSRIGFLFTKFSFATLALCTPFTVNAALVVSEWQHSSQSLRLNRSQEPFFKSSAWHDRESNTAFHFGGARSTNRTAWPFLLT